MPVPTLTKTFKTHNFTIKSLNSENRSFMAVASDTTVDRHGEVVPQDRWDLKNFLANPIIPFGHDYGSPPVAKALQVGFDELGRMILELQFPTKEIYAFADTIYNLYINGFMRGLSVGFIDHGDRLELLEVSAVPLPANPNALTLAYKSGVIDESERKSLVTNFRKQAEALEAEVIEETTAPAQKGAVSQVLQTQEERDQKSQNMDDFWNMVYAFCDVYYSDKTSPDDFQSLLKELVSLLGGLTGGEDTEAKSFTVKKVSQSELAALFVKAGAVLSTANKAKVKSALDALGACQSALSELMEAAGGDTKSLESETETVTEPEADPEQSEDPASDTNSEGDNPSEGASDQDTTEEDELDMKEVSEVIGIAVKAVQDHRLGRVQ